MDLSQSDKQRQIVPPAMTDSGRTDTASISALCQAAIEGSPDAAVIADLDSRIVLANEAACQLSGYAEAELLGMACSRIWREAGSSEGVRSGAAVAPGGASLGEATLVRKDGTAIDVERTRWTIHPAGSSYVVTVLREATYRKEGEQKLREREEAFRHMVEQANEGIVIIQHSLVQYANPRLLEMWGGTIEDVLHTAFTRYVHPDQIPLVRERHRRRMAGEVVPSTYDSVLVRKDGSPMPVELNAGVFLFQGEPADFVFVRDRTERIRADEALRESERRYAALFDHSSDGVFVFDLDLVHRAVNQRGAQMIGYAVEELIGKPISYTAAPQRLPGILRKREALLEGARIGIYSDAFRAKDGSAVPVDVNLTLVRDAAGRPLHIQSIVRDIRERRNAEQALEQHAERLRTLATRLAEVEVAERRRLARELHDQVGQNLTALALNLNLIASQASGQAEASLRSRLSDSLALLEETTGRIRDVMADLRPPVLEDYGLAAALRRYGEQFSQRTGTLVCVQGDDPDPRLAAHAESALYRIAQEALTNVAKHAQARQAEITLLYDDRCVRLEVSDDGVGFQDLSPAARDGRHSMGMMSMAERADSVGGSCRIESSPGRGTRVVVEVPR